MRNINKKGYNWHTLINEKAIWEFETEMELTQLTLSFEHYYILSYIVELCINPKKSNKLISKVIDSDLFVYMSSSFILENLVLLKIKDRTLKRFLKTLVDYSYLNRIIINKNQRFLRPSNELLMFYQPNSQRTNIELNDLAKKVGRIFGKSTAKQIDPVINFLESLIDLDYFKDQFDAYIAYKSYTSDFRHQFEKFTEVWDTKDWKLLLDQRKHIDTIKHFANDF